VGILTGTIDKLLIKKRRDEDSSSSDRYLFDVEIIDFKTNRFRGREAAAKAPVAVSAASGSEDSRAGEQASFSFDSPGAAAFGSARQGGAPVTLEDEVQDAATDYQLQMQAYALAVRELLPFLTEENSKVQVTLHFLDPNVEAHLPEDLLAPDVCAGAIDDAMRQLSSSLEPEHFPVRPATHCGMCNFLDICVAGREFVRATSG
jgi:hypothetical protein